MNINVDYYRLTAGQRFLLKLKGFFLAIFFGIVNFFKMLGIKTAKLACKFGAFVKRYAIILVKGNIVTKLSFIFMGMGHYTRKQVVKGIIYFVVEALFIVYMVFFGGTQLRKFFQGMFNPALQIGDSGQSAVDMGDGIMGVTADGDNSFEIMLYAVLTLIIVGFFVYFYFRSIQESHDNEIDLQIGITPLSIKQDANEMLNGKFHITLLTFPLLGLAIFTIIPLVCSILIAFTDYTVDVGGKLISWVGFKNITNLFSATNGLLGTFGRVLLWTLIWAVIATFSNYFAGMILAMFINKKSIKLKKLFRAVFVLTVAVPSFVSLLVITKMLASGQGFIDRTIYNLFKFELSFAQDGTRLASLTTRIVIIIVNMWIGIPYSMLICTGILMNIPADLYESAKIDGASPVRTFRSITLPYMFFVTGPYLITQFIGNLNNFNVIFFLSGGGPADIVNYKGGAQATDLLITWLYRLFTGANSTKDYKLAAVIGIMMFIICAVSSLIVYNKSSAVQKEEEFQ